LSDGSLVSVVGGFAAAVVGFAAAAAIDFADVVIAGGAVGLDKG
jgi:hypothetical protein